MKRRIGPAEIVPTLVAAGGLLGRLVWDGEVSDELVRDGGYAAFGLFLIWCRRPLSRSGGWWTWQHGRPMYVRPSPAVLIAAAGWFFLVGMPLIMYFIGRSSA